MSDSYTVLLHTADRSVVDVFRRAVAEADGVRLVVSPPAAEVASALGADPAAIVVLDPGTVAGLLPARIDMAHEGLTLGPLPLVLLVDRSEGAAATPPQGVDDVLAWPAHPREAGARLRVLLRLARAQDELGRAERELVAIWKSQSDARPQIVALLRGVLEAALPGAAERAARIASLAHAIAERFEIPSVLLEDLECAAHLHELGLVGHGQGARPPHPGLGAPDGWHYAARTRTLLARHPALAGVATLIGDVYENWDGTGQPRHLLQGQIPLRSRILRVLVDVTATLADARRPMDEAAVDPLDEHAGTLYDPMVAVHLRAVLAMPAGEEWGGRSAMVPIEELEPGMVLTENLCTDSGLKLLARGTVLTPGTLETIRRRHQAEPIEQGAAIRRPSAA